MNEISLSSIFNTIIRRIWIVIIATVMCGISAFVYCDVFETPVYQTKASIIVTNGAVITDSINSTVSNTDLAASLYLVDTCVDILKSQGIYQELSTAIADKYSYKALKSSFTVSRRSDDSLFVDVSFKSTSKSEAIEIVNAFADISSNYICAAIPSATVAVMEHADSATVVSPRTAFSTVLFAMLGAIISALVILVLATLDKAVKGEEDFKASFDIPILGAVPDFDNSSSSKKTTGGY